MDKKENQHQQLHQPGLDLRRLHFHSIFRIDHISSNHISNNPMNSLSNNNNNSFSIVLLPTQGMRVLLRAEKQFTILSY